MLSNPIFNDQKFESAEAQADFNARTASMSTQERDELYDFMGRISQFVGRVTTLDLALKHRQELALYNETEGQAWRDKQAAARGEIPRKRGRPRLEKSYNSVKAEEAHAVWKKAVVDSRAAKEAETTRVNAEIEVLSARINELKTGLRDFTQRCDDYVAACRDEWDKWR